MRGDGADRTLVRVLDGFYVEEGRLPEAQQVIVCGKRDEIDPPRIGLAL